MARLQISPASRIDLGEAERKPIDAQRSRGMQEKFGVGPHRKSELERAAGKSRGPGESPM